MDGIGNPEALFAVGQPFAERAYLGETPGQHGTRPHRGQPRQAEVLPEQRPVEGHHVLPQEVDGLRIVTQTIIHLAQEEVRHDLEGRISQGPGQGEGALASRDGAWQVACGLKTSGHIGSPPA